MKFESFLTKEEEQLVADAIELAEKNTSGEIRIHIDKKCKSDALESAKTVFAKMKMHETAFRNGVIVYIAIDDHKLAIFGDEGIHTKVDDSFWQKEIEILIDYFKKEAYLDGITTVIHEIGDKLSENFPFDQKGDKNELDNEITYGDGN